MEILNFKKQVGILLIFAVILQSCSVYKNKTITLDEAVAKSSIVKVTTIDGTTDAFDKIEKVDSIYYGLLKTDGEYTRRPINENDYVKIQPKNKPASALLTVGVIAIPLFIIAAIIGYGN